jgi:hypothetical protein
VAKYLRCDPGFDPTGGGNLSGVNYRLPADTDLAALTARIEQAMGDGQGVTVVVESEDDPLSNHRVIINCATVRSVLIAETPEPDSPPADSDEYE